VAAAERAEQRRGEHAVQLGRVERARVLARALEGVLRGGVVAGRAGDGGAGGLDCGGGAVEDFDLLVGWG
jgi:hypothetical protein